MSIFWLTFTDGYQACLYEPGIDDAEARARAQEMRGPVAKVQRLPYPARPRLDDRDGHGAGEFPSFCYRPAQCADRGTCADNRSCTS